MFLLYNYTILVNNNIIIINLFFKYFWNLILILIIFFYRLTWNFKITNNYKNLNEDIYIYILYFFFIMKNFNLKGFLPWFWIYGPIKLLLLELIKIIWKIFIHIKNYYNNNNNYYYYLLFIIIYYYYYLLLLLLKLLKLL